MASLFQHPILQQSFAIIDHEIGPHRFTPDEYAVVRRVIHSTADFDFKQEIRFSTTAIAVAKVALRATTPLILDVNMVKSGIQTLVKRTFQNPIVVAVDQAHQALPGKTRTETGMLACCRQYPGAIYIVGNAPTALAALCEAIAVGWVNPALVIGVPVGFVGVEAAKTQLASLDVPQILVDGRKGGSAVASAITNALLVLAWETV
ncbi:MAG: cobalt-precorrin-8X methylmutase [Leptolyngbyaceae cyanobacterium SL_1_1]|nr:cobalt-precorrin-8X methylmutase [Leptolyngbyaceae cyanobacterium RM1_1_2]NJO09867.1 cobalt-precorrin-8X methylmutase [Leptolyngbyaceae cyanobacterium SL_1_1]